jgi:dihydrofolate synthase/folylpolyglutamate synthase
LKLFGRDFGFVGQEQQWQFWSWLGKRSGLAHPALRGAAQLNNASTALAALDALRDGLPVAMQDVRRGMMEVELPGRFQVLPGKPVVVLDVAHNPQAATVLAQNLGNMGFHPETFAVFGIMADKDIAGVIGAMKSRVTQWLLCSLPGPRAASAARIAQILDEEGMEAPVRVYASASDAFIDARNQAGENDRIVAFGSFLTVADVMRAHASSKA